MRAVRFDSYGDESVLKVVEVDPPVAGPDQVVVAVRAAGINPGEAGIRRGAMHDRWPSTFPEGEGSDFAGTVVAVGPGVTSPAVGDEVLGFTDNRASHAEQVLAEVAHVVPKSAAIPWEAAGGLFIVGTSAYALVQESGIGPDDVVVVSAASGGVGGLTVQWARRTGATVIGLAGSESHEWLRAHDVVPVDYHGDDLAARVREAAGGQVTALLDTYGAPYTDLGLELGLAPERVLTIADFAAAEKGVRVVFHSSVANADVLTELAGAVAAGDLEIPIAGRYPLEDVADAYRELALGHTHGKIVLLP